MKKPVRLDFSRTGFDRRYGMNYLLTIVNVALLFTPPYAAVILTRVFLLVAVVVTVNAAELAPAGIVTLVGTFARAALLLADYQMLLAAPRSSTTVHQNRQSRANRAKL